MATTKIDLGKQAQAGTLTNTEVAAAAAIDYSKLAALTDGNILVGNGSNVAVSVSPSGDVTLSNAGVFGIAAGVIVNADVNASAAIAYSKLATLTAGNILVGSAGNVATSVNPSGDIDVSDTGVFSISSDSIVNADINSSAAIATSKLADSAQFLLKNTNGTITDTIRYTYSTTQTFSADGDLVSKAYVDGVVSGLTWRSAAVTLHLVGSLGEVAIEGLSPADGDTYVVSAVDGDSTIDGTAAAVGDMFEYNGTIFKKTVTNSGGFPPVGTRAILSTGTALIAPYTNATDDGKIAEFDGTSLTASLTAEATEGSAVLVTDVGNLGFNDNNQYVFEGTVPTGTWIQTNGLANVAAGAGLTKTANTMDIGAGTGITVNVDDIQIANGGVDTTQLAAGAVTNTEVDAAAAIAYSKLAALTDGNILIGSGTNVATSVNPSGDIDISNAGVFSIASGVIINADVNASAAIDYSKLATLTSGNLLVGSAGNVATSVNPTGDIDISNTGVFSIASGVIVDGDVNASAAIAFSKLATLTSANLLVGSAGNVATAVTMSGDVTMTNAGVTAIGSTKVTNAMLAGSIAQSKLAETWAIREVPTGDFNGADTTYILANTPVTGTESVYVNGMLQDEGAGDDYTITTATITFAVAPQSDDKVLVTYRH